MLYAVCYTCASWIVFLGIQLQSLYPHSSTDLKPKYLIDLVPSSLTREFNLDIGTILNCLAFVGNND